MVYSLLLILFSSSFCAFAYNELRIKNKITKGLIFMVYVVKIKLCTSIVQ
jgi:hypothetical protein